MLLKVGSDIAVAASLFVSDPAFAEDDGALPARDALSELSAQNEKLRAQLHHLETEIRVQTEQAREAGRREAAAEHVRDDERQLAVLSAALVAVRESFDAALLQITQSLAAQLAGAALSRFVESRADDAEWLLRVIAHRLADLDAATVVAVILPEACRPLADRLEVSAGTKVEFDKALPAHSARINLVMGGIPISMAEGLTRLLRVLDMQEEAHD